MVKFVELQFHNSVSPLAYIPLQLPLLQAVQFLLHLSQLFYQQHYLNLVILLLPPPNILAVVFVFIALSLCLLMSVTKANVI
jgi:hypothetical protein